ncbi:MAG: hypothetical protein LBS65_01775 [Desulfovibrio sp.]|jgi:hypothetical protein|nr:hypothetical protein [Desulfovibrio sp.]
MLILLRQGEYRFKTAFTLEMFTGGQSPLTAIRRRGLAGKSHPDRVIP